LPLSFPQMAPSWWREPHYTCAGVQSCDWLTPHTSTQSALSMVLARPGCTGRQRSSVPCTWRRSLLPLVAVQPAHWGVRGTDRPLRASSPRRRRSSSTVQRAPTVLQARLQARFGPAEVLHTPRGMPARPRGLVPACGRWAFGPTQDPKRGAPPTRHSRHRNGRRHTMCYEMAFPMKGPGTQTRPVTPPCRRRRRRSAGAARCRAAPCRTPPQRPSDCGAAPTTAASWRAAGGAWSSRGSRGPLRSGSSG
jgi:hypothetical protein